MAKGYIESHNTQQRKIAVMLDVEDFNYINTEAEDEAAGKRQPNFARTMRRIVKLGIKAHMASRPILKRKPVPETPVPQVIPPPPASPLDDLRSQEQARISIAGRKR